MIADPLEAVIALLREYPRDGKVGSVEIVFAPGGVVTHVHERRTTHLRKGVSISVCPRCQKEAKP